ncbi:MAG: NADH-quinone oxidoreductase subunit NuoE [Rhodospirillales bacterium]|jgi:NADH-quinone oxidoreductase E subunit|nr:NADH-quinone oxidoreductase subunit NuoE [Rhodospirillales bacterium]
MSDRTDNPMNIEQPASFAFNAENVARIKDVIAKYPEGKQASACMPLLDLAQRQHDGWLPHAAMVHVAELLGMPEIRVYEVATFYTMYNLKPIGKIHVQVCTSLPCWLRGSDEIVSKCKSVTGTDFGKTSDDGVFTMTETECLGACVNAPMVQIGDDFYEDLTPEAVERILMALKNGEQVEPGPQNSRHSSEPEGGLTSLTGEGA